MGRLTRRNKNGGVDVADTYRAVRKLAEYEDLGLYPADIEDLLESLGRIYEVGKFVVDRETEGDGCDE